MVIGYVPGTALLSTFTKTVAVALPPGWRTNWKGLTPTPTPTGMFASESVMFPEKPFRLVRVALELPEEPCARLMALGKRARLKFGGGTMTSTRTEWLRFALCATTVRV